MRQKLIELEGEINKSTVIMENVSTPPSITDRGSRQKISRITNNLNSATNQLDLIHIYVILQVHMEYSPRKTTFWAIYHNTTHL